MKKKVCLYLLIITIILTITGCFNVKNGNNTDNQNNNNVEEKTDNNDEQYDELFGGKESNPYYNNEKSIRNFVIKYNSNASNKVNKVEWTKNHTIAKLYFNDENCKINEHSERGYIITCEFNNGKSKVSTYDLILKDMIKIYNSNISEEEITNQMSNAKNNNGSSINITDNITIQYNYLEEPISIRAGDSYIIELILGK